MITVLIIFGLVALIIWGFKHEKTDKYDDGGAFAKIIGGAGLTVFIAVLLLSRAMNTVGNAELELAYSTTIQNYETALVETKNLLSTTRRIKEIRDKANVLNVIVVSKNYWSHEYFFGGFLWTPPAPANIKLYVLKDLQ